MKKKYNLKINGDKYEAKVLKYDGMNAIVNVNGIDFNIDIETSEVKQSSFQRVASKQTTVSKAKKSSSIKSSDIKSPIPGTILKINHKEGDHVNNGDVVMILEAMKMETEITAPADGVIKTINVNKEQSIEEDKVLFSMQFDEAEVEEKEVERPAPKAEKKRKSSGGSNMINAPLPGTILDIKVSVGDQVKNGQTVLILEAMKMETEIKAHKNGKVKSIKVSKGANVVDSQELIELGD